VEEAIIFSGQVKELQRRNRFNYQEYRDKREAKVQGVESQAGSGGCSSKCVLVGKLKESLLNILGRRRD
jgi:hypothetical protein